MTSQASPSGREAGRYVLSDTTGLNPDKILLDKPGIT